MSALGQKQTFGPPVAMSALHPKADIGQHGDNVRFVPILLQKAVTTVLHLFVMAVTLSAAALLLGIGADRLRSRHSGNHRAPVHIRRADRVNMSVLLARGWLDEV